MLLFFDEVPLDRPMTHLLQGAPGDLLMWNAVARTRFIWAIIILGAASAPAAAQHGYEAELRQCVANIQASLGGRSILGPRGTAEYIQSRGFLEDRVGITEYDLLVSRCQAEINRRRADPSRWRGTASGKHRR